MWRHLPYGRARGPLIVTNAFVGGDSNSLYDNLYALQSGRCRGCQGAGIEPVGQNKVLKEVVVNAHGVVFENRGSVLLASDHVYKIDSVALVLDIDLACQVVFSRWALIQVSCGGDSLL